MDGSAMKEGWTYREKAALGLTLSYLNKQMFMVIRVIISLYTKKF